MMRAAIDCGTNTVRLLVVDADGQELRRLVTITRLGEGVDRTGRLSDAAIQRTVAAIARYTKDARQLGADRIAIVATSAARDAANADAFAEAVEQAAGQAVSIIPGQQEARLAFAGATSDLDPGQHVAVVDVGGGSTEVVEGSAATVQRWVSMQLGSVRCAERFGLLGRIDQVRLTEVDEALRAELHEMLFEPPFAPALVGVAATATSLAAIDAQLERYDASVVHGRSVSATRIEGIRGELADLEPAQRLERFPILQPGREDVIVAGASVLLAVMRALGVDSMRASERDILDGIIQTLGLC